MDLYGCAQVLTLVAPAPVAASATSTGVLVHTGCMEGRIIAVLNAGAATAGTTPTLDAKVVQSDDGSTWSDVAGAAFPQVTDAAAVVSAIPLKIGELKAYLAVEFTLGGTNSPSFPVAVTLIGIKKYH